MPRALWSGAVSFGLVTIPIEVHTAVRENRLKFHLLRRTDQSRIKYQKVAERDGRAVEWDDLVKGFEYTKGHFIVLTKEDFESAALQKDRTITIMDFVEGTQVDDRFFDKPYYLTPGKGGTRAYAVLRECIRDTGLIGIAKFVLRDRQHLAAIEVIGDGLVLSVLRFADELVDVSSLEFPPAKDVTRQELETARMLVNAFRTDWNPAQYTDEYRANLMRIIQSKQKGRKPRLEDPQDAGHAEVIDLMERLRSSLEGRRRAAPARGGSSRTRPARAEAAERSAPRRKKARPPGRSSGGRRAGKAA
jgi:DNA end-binding protein Ku